MTELENPAHSADRRRKEVMAYLVDRNSSSCSVKELAAVLLKMNPMIKTTVVYSEDFVITATDVEGAGNRRRNREKATIILPLFRR